ncbi:hypothetical protein CFOL_v3_16011 [Cephalotus follicularis]|uniref:Uncharacterized protein n=1 Tax=Cephalotus follicularis TaxID=3775 RepID=A0A1Q3BXJ3_CEPFO|nr:hypothetical protein CFOL_v3_16011 [Cephalotus follicularis]
MQLLRWMFTLVNPGCFLPQYFEGVIARCCEQLKHFRGGSEPNPTVIIMSDFEFALMWAYTLTKYKYRVFEELRDKNVVVREIKGKKSPVHFKFQATAISKWF